MKISVLRAPSPTNDGEEIILKSSTLTQFEAYVTPQGGLKLKTYKNGDFYTVTLTHEETKTMLENLSRQVIEIQ